MKASPYLTPGSVDHRTVAETHRGQAHWGGSGPPGSTCRECIFWDGGYGYHASGRPKARSCSKYRVFAMQPGLALLR
jgi:hypothetical protein